MNILIGRVIKGIEALRKKYFRFPWQLLAFENVYKMIMEWIRLNVLEEKEKWDNISVLRIFLLLNSTSDLNK